MITINAEIPEKGKDIIGYSGDGDKYYVFRCACHNENCMKWRCSITGSEVFTTIIEWEYYK